MFNYSSYFQPLTKQPLKLEEAAVLEQRLSHRLAQLNAAVAALAAARAGQSACWKGQCSRVLKYLSSAGSAEMSLANISYL